MPRVCSSDGLRPGFFPERASPCELPCEELMVVRVQGSALKMCSQNFHFLWDESEALLRRPKLSD